MTKPLAETVLDFYAERRPQMGSSYDDATGHYAALASAKLAAIREMLEDPAFVGGERTALGVILAVEYETAASPIRQVVSA